MDKEVNQSEEYLLSVLESTNAAARRRNAEIKRLQAEKDGLSKSWDLLEATRLRLIRENTALEAKLAAAEATSVTAKAETIARAAHAGQKDTVNGDDYIRHVERVVARVEGEDAKAVAWLHDVLEDTSITEAGLRAAGIPESVVFSVTVLTKQDGAIYENYIRTILAVGDLSALAVKRADIEDHLHANCPERLRPRYEKAKQSLAINAAKTEVRACQNPKN